MCQWAILDTNPSFLWLLRFKNQIINQFTSFIWYFYHIFKVSLLLSFWGQCHYKTVLWKNNFYTFGIKWKYFCNRFQTFYFDGSPNNACYKFAWIVTTLKCCWQQRSWEMLNYRLRVRKLVLFCKEWMAVAPSPSLLHKLRQTYQLT